MSSLPRPASPTRPGAVACATVALALAAAVAWPLIAPEIEPVRPGVVLAARSPADAALTSPFGPAPVTAPVVAQAAPVASMPTRAQQPAVVAAPPGPSRPTLDAAERAQVLELLANAPALDAAGSREMRALLFHDAVLRLAALRESGQSDAELAALLAEVRAGLSERESAADLPPEVLAAARAALMVGGVAGGTVAASPFGAAR